jgi:pullulanase/glycogen debranching enzyme
MLWHQVTGVVYNHTGEAVSGAPTTVKANLWSLRGLDNASYWPAHAQPRQPDDRKFYYDITGTGNTINGRHRWCRT